jgi:DNA topoisomerase-2
MNYLNKKKFKVLVPWWRNYTGDVKLIKGRYFAYGKMEVINTTTVKITELPPNMTYEKYEKHLNTLLEKKFISHYDNNCTKHISYTIKFRRDVLDTWKVKMPEFYGKMKLVETHSENLTTLDEYGKLKVFDNVEQVIKHFVDFRLAYYDKRKAFIIKKLERELMVLNNRARFIKAIIDKKLVVNNQPKDKIVDNLTKMKFDLVDDSYSYLLSMSIYNLTKEMYQKLINEEKEKKDELKLSKKLVSMEMYIADLSELKRIIKKELK